MRPQRRYEGIKKARKVLHIWRTPSKYEPWYDDDSVIAKRLIYTRRPCSCLGCHGHVRYWCGPSRQERQAEDEYEVQIAEMGECY